MSGSPVKAGLFRAPEDMPIEDRLLRYADSETRREAAETIRALRQTALYWQNKRINEALDRRFKLLLTKGGRR